MDKGIPDSALLPQREPTVARETDTELRARLRDGKAENQRTMRTSPDPPPRDVETESAKQTQRHLGTKKTRGQSESTQTHPQSLAGCPSPPTS